MLHDDETRWNSFGNLGYSITTGNASFDMLYGESYFDYLAKHPHLSKRFDEAMTIVSHEEDKRIAQLISFQGTIADIGGGKGQLLEAIISSHPTSKGILVDLPEAIHAAPNNPSITKIVGNFFAPMHIDANTFILKRILHDWDDKKALDILNNISNTMDKNATLYIIDGLLDQAQDKKLLSAIDLVLLTIFKGQERTLQEMRSLAQQANLEIIQYFPINDLIFVLECKRI